MKRERPMATNDGDETSLKKKSLNRRNILSAARRLPRDAIATGESVRIAQAQQPASQASGNNRNIIVIMGDDIGMWISAPITAADAGGRRTSISSPRGHDLHGLLCRGELHGRRANFITGELPIRTA